jgi:hypothetical protein
MRTSIWVKEYNFVKSSRFYPMTGTDTFTGPSPL